MVRVIVAIVMLFVFTTPIAAQGQATNDAAKTDASNAPMTLESAKKEITELRNMIQQLNQQIAKVASQSSRTTPQTEENFIAEHRRNFTTAKEAPIVKACRAARGKALINNRGQFIGCVMD